nr:hypothetical protein [Moritella viscosa]SHO17595.1 Putative glutamate synthase, large subunit [Moritella viscosa]
MFEYVDLNVEPVFTIVSNHSYTMTESLQLADPNLVCISPTKADNLLDRVPHLLIVSDDGLSRKDKVKLAAYIGLIVNEDLLVICLSHDAKNNPLSEYVDTICQLPIGGNTCEIFNQIANTLIEAIVLRSFDSTDFSDMHHHFKGTDTTQFRQSLARGEAGIKLMTDLLPADDYKTVVIIVKSGLDFTMNDYEDILTYIKNAVPTNCKVMVMVKICEAFKSSRGSLVSVFINGNH